MDIVVRCATCYPVRLGDCPDALTFNIGITANTEYAYEICDSQGNTYEGETTTNGSGNVSISTSDVPFDAYPGLFNKWSGSFRLTLYDGDGDAVPFTVSGTEYSCIAFSFRETVELDECNDEVFCGCLSGGYAFPSDLVGQDGDFYIVENSGVILEKVDGAWTVFFVPATSSGVTSVTATAPIASSGGATPNITHNNSGVAAGSYTNASVTVDATGHVTAASSGAAPVTSVSGTAGRVTSTGGTTPVLDLATTAVTPGSYTNSNITVDAYGRVTAAANGSGGASYLVWMGKYTTVSASNGIGFTTYPWTLFGSITIPANTVQAGDIIEVKATFRSNGAGTGNPMWLLRDHPSMPSSAVFPSVADSNGNKTFVNYGSSTAVFHAGFNSAMVAAATGFTAIGASTVAGSNIGGNGIIDVYDFQSLGLTQYVDSTMAWNVDRYVVFGHTSAVATLITFTGAWVKIYRA